MQFALFFLLWTLEGTPGVLGKIPNIFRKFHWTAYARSRYANMTRSLPLSAFSIVGSSKYFQYDLSLCIKDWISYSESQYWTRPASVKITTSCIFDDIETFSSCSASQLCSEAVSGIYSQKFLWLQILDKQKRQKQSSLQRLQEDSHTDSRI